MKPHASGFRATYLTIMNEDGVDTIPNWHIADINFHPKHMVPAPCQRKNMETKGYESEANDFLYLDQEKVGDIPRANSCTAIHAICQVWKVLNEHITCLLGD